MEAEAQAELKRTPALAPRTGKSALGAQGDQGKLLHLSFSHL